MLGSVLREPILAGTFLKTYIHKKPINIEPYYYIITYRLERALLYRYHDRV